MEDREDVLDFVIAYRYFDLASSWAFPSYFRNKEFEKAKRAIDLATKNGKKILAFLEGIDADKTEKYGVLSDLIKNMSSMREFLEEGADEEVLKNQFKEIEKKAHIASSALEDFIREEISPLLLKKLDEEELNNWLDEYIEKVVEESRKKNIISESEIIKAKEEEKGKIYVLKKHLDLSRKKGVFISSDKLELEKGGESDARVVIPCHVSQNNKILWPTVIYDKLKVFLKFIIPEARTVGDFMTSGCTFDGVDGVDHSHIEDFDEIYIDSFYGYGAAGLIPKNLQKAEEEHPKPKILRQKLKDKYPSLVYTAED